MVTLIDDMVGILASNSSVPVPCANCAAGNEKPEMIPAQHALGVVGLERVRGGGSGLRGEREHGGERESVHGDFLGG